MTKSELRDQVQKDFNERNSSWVKAAQNGGDKAGAMKNDALLAKEKRDDQAERIRLAIPQAKDISQEMRDKAVAEHSRYQKQDKYEPSAKYLKEKAEREKATAERRSMRAKQVEDATYDAGKDYDKTYSPLYRKLANTPGPFEKKPEGDVSWEKQPSWLGPISRALGATSKEQYVAMSEGKYSNPTNKIPTKGNPQPREQSLIKGGERMTGTPSEPRQKQGKAAPVATNPNPRPQPTVKPGARMADTPSAPRQVHGALPPVATNPRGKNKLSTPAESRSAMGISKPLPSAPRQEHGPRLPAATNPRGNEKAAKAPVKTAKATARGSRHDDGRHQIDDALEGDGYKEEARLANAEKLQGPELRPLKFKARPNPRNIA